MSVLDAKVVSKEPLDSKDARWIKLVSTTYKDPSGRQRKWEQAERTTRLENSDVDAVGIVAFLEEKSRLGDDKDDGPSILLEKQFRPAVGKVCIEVPAGLIDAGEGIEKCALRELQEETGYVGKLISPVSGDKDESWVIGPVLYNDPGICNTSTRMIYISVDLSLPENQNPKSRLEDGEFIECFSVPLRRLYSECRRLESQDFAIDARVGTLAEGIECARRFRLQ